MRILAVLLCICALIFTEIAFAQERAMEPTKTVIILLGPPGSGKGTQAVRLTKELGIPHICTGDLFRDNISRNTELGKHAKSYIDAGKLVPDAVVLDMLFDRVSNSDCAKGYLLDGFPRTLAQAEALDRHLEKGTKLIVINLNVPDDIIVKRIAGRLTCKACGNVHNAYFSPPAKDGICDKCGGTLFTRPDDKPEVVEERLRVYHSQTAPLVAFYGAKDVVQNIDGTQSPDQVFNVLLQSMR